MLCQGPCPGFHGFPLGGGGGGQAGAVDPVALVFISEVGEEPCENCWETLRLYEIYAQHLPEDDILHGYDNIYLVIRPNPADPNKFQLFFAKDTKKPGG